MASTKSKRRSLNPISLAFLDVMFCGFGAVILIFLILDHTSSQTPSEQNPDLAAEVNLLREEVRDGELGLVALRNTFSDVSFEVVTAEGLARRDSGAAANFLCKSWRASKTRAYRHRRRASKNCAPMCKRSKKNSCACRRVRSIKRVTAFVSF